MHARRPGRGGRAPRSRGRSPPRRSTWSSQDLAVGAQLVAEQRRRRARRRGCACHSSKTPGDSRRNGTDGPAASVSPADSHPADDRRGVAPPGSRPGRDPPANASLTARIRFDAARLPTGPSILAAWISTSSSWARRARCRPRSAGAPSLLVRRGRRAASLRLRRGNAAAAPGLGGRARRPARGLLHALPRRPLPRPAGDAEDVRAARARGADHVYGPAGSRRRSSPTCAGSSASSRTSTRSSSSARATACRATATSSRSFPVLHGRSAVGYTLLEDDRPGRFDVATADALGVPAGPERGALQRGEPVTLADGTVVGPEQVLGPPRRGRKVSITGDTAPSSDVVEAVRNADVLVHEATFLEDEQDRARETLHSTALDAAAAAREADVGLLALDASVEPLPRPRRGARGADRVPGDGGAEGLRYDRGRVRGTRRASARQGGRAPQAGAPVAGARGGSRSRRRGGSWMTEMVQVALAEDITEAEEIQEILRLAGIDVADSRPRSSIIRARPRTPRRRCSSRRRPSSRHSTRSRP